MPELNLRCPGHYTYKKADGTSVKAKCCSENIIWARVPGPTCRIVMSEYGICRECWHKDKIEKFQEEYEIHHDADGQPEYDPYEHNSNFI